MSWQATAYVKELCVCPDGASLSRGQKLLLFVLADYHNTAHKVAWPSVPRLAEESMASLTQIKRDLSYLEEHCVIARKRPEKYGAGRITGYSFLALDDNSLLAVRLQKRVQNAPFFCSEEKGNKRVHGVGEIDPKPVHSNGERGTERVHGGQRNKEEQGTSIQLEPENKEQHTVVIDEDQAASTPSVKNPLVQRALKAWIAAKDQLRDKLGSEEWSRCVRPAMLLKVISGRFLLIALPPNQQIHMAAKQRGEEFRQALARYGFSLAGFTVYPDNWMREQMAKHFPDISDTMLGRHRED